MITTLSIGGGEAVEETPELPQQESFMGKAKVTRGSRAGEIVEIVEEKGGMTTAVWTDAKGTQHRFRAPSNMFEPIATRRRAKRAKKKKSGKKKAK